MSKSTGELPILIAAQQTGQLNESLQPGTRFEVPIEGSLGLLALGAKGLDVWRKVRDKAWAETHPTGASSNDK